MSAKHNTKKTNPIVLKRGTRLGDLDAETDFDLMSSCFVDNGELDILMDVRRAESIIVGRTGAGKSALILSVKNRSEKSRIIDPNDISIRFLESSDIVQFFEKIGVKLDLFYKVLWRHILTVELLKLRYNLKDKTDSTGILQTLLNLVNRDAVKKEALTYFKEWGDKFWLDTDEQLIEVTKKLENDIKAGIGGSLFGVTLTAEGAEKLTEEQKTQIVSKANKVVSQLQIKKLHDILELLAEEVFDDKQQQYYLLIDKLDEDWASTDTRYKFIRALIEEIKTFRSIQNAKVIVSLRKDLLDVVFDKTRCAGFQQEKYESYILPINWSKESLCQLISKRISEVFRRQYTRENVKANDVFYTPKSGGSQPLDYIIERSLFRPRDVIQFVNECFALAIDKHQISRLNISNAESSYSHKRLNSLFEEWAEIYPCLNESIEILREQNSVFYRKDIADRIEGVLEELYSCNGFDPCSDSIKKYLDSGGNISDVTVNILACFFRVGAVGVKLSSHDPYIWADYSHATLSKSEIKRVNQIKVHKMLHRTLGIRETKERGVK